MLLVIFQGIHYSHESIFFLQTTCINIKWSDHEHCMRDCIGNWFLNRFRELVTKNQWIFIFPTWKKQVFFCINTDPNASFGAKTSKILFMKKNQGWELDFLIFDLSIFSIFKKIDRDRIALVDLLKRSTVSESFLSIFKEDRPWANRSFNHKKRLIRLKNRWSNYQPWS